MKQNYISFDSVTRIFLVFAIVLLSSVKSFASDSNGYYWYNNHVSAYPTGKGLVYAAEEAEDEPSDNEYVDEMPLKFYSRDGDDSFMLWGKPADGYQITGATFVENGLPGTIAEPYLWELAKQLSYSNVNNFVEIGGSLSQSRLLSSHSEDCDNEYYSEEYLNDVMVVFGKVRADFLIDNICDFNEDKNDSLISNVVFSHYLLYKLLDPHVSDLANDEGDQITLTTLPLLEWYEDSTIEVVVVDTIYEQELVRRDTIWISEDDFLVEPVFKDIIRCEEHTDIETIKGHQLRFWLEFKYWTDSKGNIVLDDTFDVKVHDLDTYTAHYIVYSSDIDSGMHAVSQQKMQNNSIVYDLSGRPICTKIMNENGESLKAGIYIVDGKKIYVK